MKPMTLINDDPYDERSGIRDGFNEHHLRSCDPCYFGGESFYVISNTSWETNMGKFLHV
jgi:hypothetical protein